MATKKRTWLIMHCTLITSLPLFFLLNNAQFVDAAPEDRIIDVLVSAADGGIFTDDPDRPQITITVPPGALSEDVELRVRPLTGLPGAGEHQTVASQVLKVKLKPQGDRDQSLLELTEPIKIEITADSAPEHPQIGEIAKFNRDAMPQWERMQANFFRESDSTVVALTTDTRGKFRVIHRTLQQASGSAVERGAAIFMNETYGNENFFGGLIGLHEVLNSVAPVSAVMLGAQVDLTKVPQAIVDVMTGDDLTAKDDALADPATTRTLIKADAVIGVRGFYETEDPTDNVMVSVGLTCALCHTTVAPTEFELTSGTSSLPIGVPNIDGVPNTSLDAGAILALTPLVQELGQSVIDELNSWGSSNFDVRALPDNPVDDGVINPTSIPPLWNFTDLSEQQYQLLWDGLFQDDGTNNNALAGVTELAYDAAMHANGAFGTDEGTVPPELAFVPPQEILDSLAAAEDAEPGNDIPLEGVLDVQAWMRSLASPAPEAFDEGMAQAGFELFFGKANCVACHTSPEFTGPGLFTDITARPPTGDLAGGIKVAPLRGISKTAPYFHDGSAATLDDVLARYVNRGQQVPNLTESEQAQIVEYLNSL